MRLVTLLVNLLDNAWKYSGEKKEIELTADAVPGLVEIRSGHHIGRCTVPKAHSDIQSDHCMVYHKGKRL